MGDFLIDLLRTLKKGSKRGALEVFRAWDYLLYGCIIYLLGWLLYFLDITRPLVIEVISENLAPNTFRFFLIVSYIAWALLFLLIALFGIEETSLLFSFAKWLNKLEKFIMALPLVAASQYFAATVVTLGRGSLNASRACAVMTVLLIVLAMSFPSLWFLPDSEYWRNLRNSDRRRGGWILFFSNSILAVILLMLAFSIFAGSFGKPLKFNLGPQLTTH